MSDLAQIRIEVNTGDVRRASDDLNRMGGAGERSAAGVNYARNAVMGLGAALGAMALVATTRELIQFADKMSLIDSRIKVATGSTNNYTQARKQLIAVSLATNTSFEANAQIFGRVNKQMEQMGGTIQNTISFTKGLAQALRISGASAGETSSVITQMSQALGAGTLRGDEFRSMMENAPRVAQALADGLHVTVGALRAMSMEGKLSAKTVIEALQSQSRVLDEEFKRIPLTVGAAMENVRTAFGDYIQTANSASGATSGLAADINAVAGNIRPIVEGITTALKVMAVVYGGQIVVAIGQYINAQVAASIAAREASAATAAQIAVSRQQVVIDEQVAAANVNLTAARIASIRAKGADLIVSAELVAADRAQAIATLQAATTAETRAAAQTNLIAINAQAAGINANLAKTTEQIALAETQATLAAERLAAAQAALAAQNSLSAAVMGVLNTEISFSAVAMGALNAAMGIYIGWQIGSYLNEFSTTQNLAAIAISAAAQAWEHLNYSVEYNLNLLSFNSSKNAELKTQHNQRIADIQAITRQTVAWNDENVNTAKLSQETAAALESLKSPEDAHAARLAKITAELASGAIKQDEFTKLKAKLDDQLQIQLDSKPLTEYQEAMAKLDIKIKEVTLSSEEFAKVTAEAKFTNPEEAASYVQRLAFFESAKVAKEAEKKATDDQIQSEKSLNDAYAQTVQTGLKEIAIGNDRTKAAGVAYDIESGALKDLDAAQKAHLLTLAEAQDANALQLSAADAYKAALGEQIQRLNEATMSENALYQAKLKNAGLSRSQIQTVTAAKAKADTAITAKSTATTATKQTSAPATDWNSRVTAQQNAKPMYQPYSTPEQVGVQINQTQVNNVSSVDFAKEQANKALMAIYGKYKQVNEDIGATAQRVADQTKAVMAAGKRASNDFANAIVTAAGGLQSFTNGVQTFNDKFYSATEKTAINTQNLVNELAAVNTKLPATREGYRKLVLGLNTANLAEAKRYGTLLKMSIAADTYYTSIEKITASTETAAGAIADANKVITDSIAKAKADLLTAHKSEKSTIQSTIKTLFDFGKGLKAFRDSLVLGDLSDKTNLQKYAEATNQFNDTVAIINAGAGTTAESQALYEKAVGDLQAKSTAFLTASRVINASGDKYSTDLSKVLAAIDSTAKATDTSKAQAEQQLINLDAVVGGLIDISDKTLTVKQAIDALNAANAAQNANIVNAILGKPQQVAPAAVIPPPAAQPLPQAAASTGMSLTQNTQAAGVSSGSSGVTGDTGGGSTGYANPGSIGAAGGGESIGAIKGSGTYQQEANISATGQAGLSATQDAFNKRNGIDYVSPEKQAALAAEDTAKLAMYEGAGSVAISAKDSANMTVQGSSYTDMSIAGNTQAAMLTGAIQSGSANDDMSKKAIAAAKISGKSLSVPGSTAKWYFNKSMGQWTDGGGSWRDNPPDGAHKNGLKSVPFDNYSAILHKDERVLTAKEAKTYNASESGSGSGNLEALLKQLIEIMGASGQGIVEAVMQSGNSIVQSNKQKSNVAMKPEVV